MGFADLFRRRPNPRRHRFSGHIVRAKFDAAQTTADNRRHWANADGLSPDAAASPEVRAKLRNRARYEVANNSHARGIVLTLANDTIGTGPRLQFVTENDEFNRDAEARFAEWADAIGLARKLSCMYAATVQDGESFAVMFSNPDSGSEIQLDLRPIEADQVATPDRTYGAVDGIVFDQYGNPIRYHILRAHPGSGLPEANQYDVYPAENVLHFFRMDRPGQTRGLTYLLPALPLFALWRRYILAVVAAAETAANMAVFMKTTSPPGGEAAEVEPMTEMEFTPNMAVFTPEGWEPSQLKAEQPATTLDMFDRVMLRHIARCLNMPYNVASGDSSSYNYASGRLDHQTYYRSIRCEQAQFERMVLDRILHAWLAEAIRAFELSPPVEGLPPHVWMWEGHEHVDPVKEATAQQIRLTTNTTTLADECARQGKDWQAHLLQRAREIKLMRELGLAATSPQSQDSTSQDRAAQREAQQEEQADAVSE